MKNVKSVVMVLADGFEEIEALATADCLKRFGVNVELTGLNAREVLGAHGTCVLAESVLSDSGVARADAVILPGGLPGATHLRDSVPLRLVLQETARRGAIVAAICAAPIVLKVAGLIENKRVTGYPGAEKLSGSCDLHFTGARTERDGNIVTGKGPGASFAFARAVAEAVGVDKDTIDQTFAAMFVSE